MKAEALLLMLALADGCVQGAAHQEPVPELCPHQIEVLLIGDSITWQPGYRGEVRRAYDWGQVVNAAWPGTATPDWLPSRVAYQGIGIDTLRPRVVSILLGTNDATEPRATSSGWYHENLDWLVWRLLQDGAGRVVVMTPPRYGWQIWPFDQAAHDRLAEYSEVIADLCGVPDDRIDCGPNLRELLDVQGDLADGLHPNAQGHAKIAAALLPLLEPAVGDGCVAP